MYQLYRNSPLLLLAIIIANVVLSAWCIYHDPVINNDGVTYLALAEYMSAGNWQAAFDFYSWPFYSVFVVAVSKLLFIDIEAAAYVLNTLLAVSLTLAFVSIVGELSGHDRKIILIAAVVILLFPSINKYRSFIIRDFGYLSCYLWSLYFIFRFCKTFNKSHLVAWLFFAALSCLFRFEGIVFLLIAPYFLLLFSATNLPHRRKVLASLSLLLVTVSVMLVFWYVNDKYSAMLEMAAQTGRNIDGLADLFLANIGLAGKQSLADYALVVSGSFAEVFYELLRRMAVLYLVFAVVAYVNRLTLHNELQRKVWLVYVVTNLVVLIGFSLFNNFLVSRYTLATALSLLLLAPFAIYYLWNSAMQAGGWRRPVAFFVLVALSVISLERLGETTNKMHLKNSGKWLAENVAGDSRIYSNDKLIIYYAQRSPSDNLDHLYSTGMLVEFFQTNQLQHYDYLAYRLDDSVYADNILRQTLIYRLGSAEHIEHGGDQRYVMIFDLSEHRRRVSGKG